jgi:hypothetical protein
MSIIASNNGATRELIPAGNYIARCISMIEIGTVAEQFMGETKTLKKVRIGWELPTETRVFNEDKGEQPLMISKEYTLSMNEKSNLRKDLKSWRGKDFTDEEARSFDITKLLGQPCMLNIIHTRSKSDPTKVYEQISGITSIPKGMNVPKQVNDTVMICYDKFNQEAFERLPDFIKTKMKGSLEWAAMAMPHEKSLTDSWYESNGGKEEIEYQDDLPF